MPTQKEDPMIDFGDLTEKNVGLLRVLNSAIFPVKYNDKFYTDLLLPGREQYTKLAFYCDVLVGAVCCRREEKGEGTGSRMYMMTLGVLAPYRNLGIGSKLLEHAINVCSKVAGVTELFLHVQTNNTPAIDFYQKFGFITTETIKGYYKRIEPPDCYVLTKKLHEKQEKS